MRSGAKTRIKSNEGIDALDVANKHSYFTVAKIISDHQKSTLIKSKEEIYKLVQKGGEMFKRYDQLGIGRIDKQSLQKCIKEVIREADLPEDTIGWEEISTLCQTSSSISESNFISWLEGFLKKYFPSPSEQEKEGDSVKDDILPESLDL